MKLVSNLTFVVKVILLLHFTNETSHSINDLLEFTDPTIDFTDKTEVLANFCNQSQYFTDESGH